MIEEKKHGHNFLFCEENDYKLYQGKMQDVLDTFQEESVDCIITDPPYELNFMGKKWDNSGVAFQPDTWKHCFRVLKEGGYLLAFGGTRTFHRIACAIEDAGFEIRDTIMWLYGSGMPKGCDIGLAIDKKNGVDNKTGKILTNGTGKNDCIVNIASGNHKEYFERKAQNEWDGWGTTLKPAYEPIILARKPLQTTLVDNVLENGLGGLNIDECRVGEEHFEQTQKHIQSKGIYGDMVVLAKSYDGRFPANVILTYDENDFDEVCGGMPYTKSNGSGPNYEKINSENRVYVYGKNKTWYKSGTHFDDEGSASRYFYCAKATTKDRDEGLDLAGFETVQITDGSVRANPETGWAFSANPTPRRNIHPTVKPTELMEYLIKLVAPKGSVILDPFMGSGSTGKAVMFQNRERNANYKFIGIEMTPEYLPICQARIDFAKNKYEYETKKELEEQRKTNGQQNIFDFL